jgi:large subunit ribosomal protein L15
MEFNNLPSTTQTKLRRLGQGHGSGRGKTSGRGTKGQKARGHVPVFFEGGGLPLTKRMPFLRGRGRNKIIKNHAVELNISDLSKLPAKTVVDVDNLVKNGLVDKKAIGLGVKLIGNSKVSVKYEIKIPASAGARKSIEEAGGSFLP